MKFRLIDTFAGIGGFSLALEAAGIAETAAFVEIDPYCQKVLRRHWPGVPIYEDIRDVTKERLVEDGVLADAKHESHTPQRGKCSTIAGESCGRRTIRRRSAGDAGREGCMVCAGHNSSIKDGVRADPGCTHAHGGQEDQPRESVGDGKGFRNRGKAANHTQRCGGAIITGGFPCQDLSHAGKQAGIEAERSGLWSELVRLTGEIRPDYAIYENVSALLSGDDGRWFARVLGDLAEIGFDAEWNCIPASNSVYAPHHRDRIWIVAYPASE